MSNNQEEKREEQYSSSSEIITSKVSFEKKLDPSQIELVEKVLEGLERIHSFRLETIKEQNDTTVGDLEQQKESSSSVGSNGGAIKNHVLHIEYNPKEVSIYKIVKSFHNLGLKNRLQQAPTSLSTSQKRRQTKPRNREALVSLFISSSTSNAAACTVLTATKTKCRSSFHVNGICCATEVPIVTSIIESIPSKGGYIDKININIPLRMVYVTYNPEEVTAGDILNELKQQGFENSTIIEDGNVSYERRKKKNAQQQQQSLQIHQPSKIPTIKIGGRNKFCGIIPTTCNNIVDNELTGALIPTITFVESVLHAPSLSQDAIETMEKKFTARDFLHDSIRSYSPNIASKTIKIEHNPNLVSIQNILDTLKMDDNKGGISNGRIYFDDCIILVDGYCEGLVLPSNVNRVGDQMQDQRGDNTTTAHESRPISYYRQQLQQKGSRWLRACGIGTEHGLSISIILSGIFWILSIIGGFIDNQILMYLGLLAVIFGLPPVARKAFRTLRRKQFDANCMMVTAALGAVALGEFDEAASVSFLFAISEYLEDQATRKAKKAMDEIINLRPEYANYIDKGTNEIRIVPVNDLDIDDHVSVRMGDKIPTDGIIVEGFTQIDESSLTGESMPVNKTIGDTVSGGTINVGGTRLVIRTTALVEDSAVSRLIRLVEESASSRSPTELLVDSFARSYTPTVVVIAAILCTIPWFWGFEIGRKWTLNGLIIIVIACPCALTISTPVTYAAGLAATAQKGIIVKGGSRLEALGNVKRIVFDKTGTLTEGKFRLVDLQAVGNKKCRKEVLKLLAIMEGPSSHPLAATLVKAAKDEGIQTSNVSVTEHSILKGEGVTAKIDNQETYVGNVRLFRRLGMFDELLDEQKKTVMKWNDEGSTVGFIGIKGVGIIGMFCVADAVRLEAKEVVETMRKSAIDVFMLTGDGEGPAKTVASQVGIPEDNTRSQFLPGELWTVMVTMRVKEQID